VKNNFSQLLNVHRIRDVRQIEIHTAGALVREPSASVVEIASAEFKKCKLPGIGRIPAELIQAGDELLLSNIHKLINSVWINKYNCSNYHGISLLSTSYKI
jgi:hypothetical protein